ncbi:lamin tail domain-containing protein [Akkermansiaceae bacterium]|nr:lamin tail domain-containing protein [Akkermansiaceae bacterium]
MKALYILKLAGLSALFVAPVSAKIWISEIVADNDGSHLDEDNDESDWVELYNDGAGSVDLGGWSLTDDDANLQKWVFPPGATIGSQGYLVVFASGKNRRVPGNEYHTNYSLKRSGEYLGLIQADGSTVEHDYAAQYPGQFSGASYGVSQTGGSSQLLATGAPGQAAVPTSAADFTANYSNWNTTGPAMTGSTWRNVNSGVGYETTSGYGNFIGTNGSFLTEMLGNNGSVFLRLPFTLSSASAGEFTLRMRWDDGFIAYINGVQVAADQHDTTPEWNSTATDGRTDAQNDDWVNFTIDPSILSLVAGENILAIHGMNETANSSDMLILPELEVVVPGAVRGSIGYHTTVTPGAPNGTSLATVPPLIRDVTDQPERPAGGAGSAPLLITAEVQNGTTAVSQVRLFHRIMFSSESSLVMNDSGLGGDAVAGDGIYSALLPTTSLDSGEMMRWRVEAEDTVSGVSLSPPYLDPVDADRYYGTVALNSAHDSSQLTIIETFVQNEVAVDTVAGTTASIYYLGNFYDNVQMDRHGQSTGAFPKKSYDLDFNKGNRFLWKEGEERVKDTNLLTNWADKSKVRNAMGYEFLRRCGSPSHYAFPIRMDRNGEFFSITDLVEDGDDRFLDRVGLDREGTLYKMYDKIEVASKAVKKSRKELGTDDLQALINGLNEALPRDTRREYAYDNLDLAATVNHLAAYVVAGISDTGHKNFYMYRDTEGDGEWTPLPWDVDLSAGRRWNSTDKYFDDSFFSNLWIRSPNRLWELIHNTPEFRHMILRRIATLRKEILLSTGDASAGPDWYDDMVKDLRDQMDPIGIVSDSDLDYDKWGSWGNNDRSRTAASRILFTWLPAKRSYIFSSARNQGGVSVPADQPSIPPLTIETVEFLPVSGNQDEEYLVVKNHGGVSVDLSGFTLIGGVDYTFPPGTVIPSGAGNAGGDYIGTLHLVRDANAFRARSTGPTSGEYRFIQEGYQGQFSARGETTELRNAEALLVDSFSYTGAPTLAQQGLRVTEINYHPSNPTATEQTTLPGVTDSDFEFIELKNISGATLDLSGAQFTEGVAYTFASGVMVPAGQRLILAKNPAAFAVRYPSVSAQVVGPYLGLLNNDGDTLRLVDGVGENILVITYNDRWYPPSDGGGQSLVLAGSEAAFSGLNVSSAWGLSTALNGSPGAADATISTHYNAWQEGNFNEAQWADPAVGTAEADPDGDGLLNWEEYAFGTDPNVADVALFEGEVVTTGGQTYLGARVKRRINGADLLWQLQKGSDMQGWANQVSAVVSAVPQGGGTELALIRETSVAGTDPKKFVRLKVTYQP